MREFKHFSDMAYAAMRHLETEKSFTALFNWSIYIFKRNGESASLERYDISHPYTYEGSYAGLCSTVQKEIARRNDY